MASRWIRASTWNDRRCPASPRPARPPRLTRPAAATILHLPATGEAPTRAGANLPVRSGVRGPRRNVMDLADVPLADTVTHQGGSDVRERGGEQRPGGSTQLDPGQRMQVQGNH